MAANPDHLRRDAEDAARAEIRLFLNRFGRRMYEQAKATIAEQISTADAGELLDGSQIGRAAAARAIGAYQTAEPIDIVDTPALGDATADAA